MRGDYQPEKNFFQASNLQADLPPPRGSFFQEEWPIFASVIVHFPPISGLWIQRNQTFSECYYSSYIPYSYMCFLIWRILETVCLCAPCHLWRLTLNWLGCRILYCDKKNNNKKKTLQLSVFDLFQSTISFCRDRQLNSPCPSSSLELARLSLMVRTANNFRKQMCCTETVLLSSVLFKVTKNNGCYTNCSVKVYVRLFHSKVCFSS